MKAFSNHFLIGIFALALVLPAVEMITGVVSEPDIDENRFLAPFPTLEPTKASIKAFPSAFEKWYSDHLGLRGTLVQSYRYINQDLFDSADSVLVGRDGWLYLLRDTVDYAERLPLPADLCGRNPFTSDQLNAWVEALVENRKRIEALGAHYVLMIVPNKQSVHPEYLPDRVKCTRGARRVDQLRARLAAIDGFPLLRIEERFLQEAKNGVQLWHKTDTHWNATGASLGYRALKAYTETTFGEALPDPLDDGRIRIIPLESGGWGLSRMLGTIATDRETSTTLDINDPDTRSVGNALPGYSRGPLRPTERFVNDRKDLPRALALHDSFFDKRFKSLLSESFSVTDFVWHRGVPKLDRELGLIRELAPDLVIHEMVERNLLHPYFGEN